LQKTQEEHAATRKAIFVANQDTNFQMAREKRDRDADNFNAGQEAGKNE